jgi:hypothetical protein
MSTWAVSPAFTNERLQQGDLNSKLDVFEDQVVGWVLNHAAALDGENYALRQHSGIAVLMLVLSYFEQIAAYIRGEDSRGRSADFFRYGLLQVFPELEGQIAQYGVRNVQAAVTNICMILYSEARCGLFHEAMIWGRILIARDQAAAIACMADLETGDIASVVVDPWRFLGNIRGHFDQYLRRLRDPDEVALRANFERFWDARMARRGAMLPPQDLPPNAPEIR